MSYGTILKGIAKANKVKLGELTRKMIQNAPIPVRYKKFLQGETLGEARIANSIKSSRATVPLELKALGVGLAAGSAATKLVNDMWSTTPKGLDKALEKRGNNVTAADRKSAMEKQAARKRALRDLEQAKDKRLKGDVENVTAPKPEKRISKDVPGVKKSLRPKARPKSNAPKTSLRPKLRPKEKMMGGGMATKKKPTGYMYGGMAKKPKAKK